MSIKVKCEVRRYEDRDGDRPENVVVESHDIYRDRVLLRVNGQSVIVFGRDLINAVSHAMSTR